MLNGFDWLICSQPTQNASVVRFSTTCGAFFSLFRFDDEADQWDSLQVSLSALGRVSQRMCQTVAYVVCEILSNGKPGKWRDGRMFGKVQRKVVELVGSEMFATVRRRGHSFSAHLFVLALCRRGFEGDRRKMQHPRLSNPRTHCKKGNRAEDGR